MRFCPAPRCLISTFACMLVVSAGPAWAAGFTDPNWMEVSPKGGGIQRIGQGVLLRIEERFHLAVTDPGAPSLGPPPSRTPMRRTCSYRPDGNYEQRASREPGVQFSMPGIGPRKGAQARGQRCGKRLGGFPQDTSVDPSIRPSSIALRPLPCLLRHWHLEPIQAPGARPRTFYSRSMRISNLAGREGLGASKPSRDSRVWRGWSWCLRSWDPSALGSERCSCLCSVRCSDRCSARGWG